MSKRVIFRIDNGDFDRGFSVTLTIKENGEVCAPEVKGKLTPAPEIIELYHQWQESYNSWGQNYRWWRRKIDVPSEIETNCSGYSEDDINKYAHKFEAALNEWLDRPELQELREELERTVNKKDTASFIVQTDCKELQKFPWELWRLLKNGYNAEVVLSQRSFPKKVTWKSSVKILVILGSDENIDIKTDWNIIKERLQKDELVTLEQPSKDDVVKILEAWPWDIIFFAGHSSTDQDGNDARIWINEHECLSPKQLKNSLKIAVKKGLKLAIFNSCDGLGLARQLESLQIPHIIVMRQRIHDRVAQMFLDTCLKSFANGASLHEAVWKARKKLQEIEISSPSASWLPVIFQNPEEPPLFYRRKNYHRLLKLLWCGMGAIATSKRVILRIDEGNFDQGFPITLTITENNEICAEEVKGWLAPKSEILQRYDNWQNIYDSWEQTNHWWGGELLYHKRNDVVNSASNFQASFNEWLADSSLKEIQWQVLRTVREDESVRFIIKTDNQELQKLPWERWRLIQNYYYAEVALSSTSVPPRGGLSSPVKILAILGSDDHIDISPEWKIFVESTKTLKPKLMMLRKPTVDELKKILRSQPWDIVYFSGHSATNPETNDVQIWLDDQTPLSLQNIQRDLQKAVRNGLKLAIVISGDGLGLPRQLEKLQIPHIVAMRKAADERLAMFFLEHFLTSFAKGESLHRAVCEARKKLSLDQEDRSPSASWLPVIFQNPEEPPLFYRRKNYNQLLKLVWCGMGAIATLTLGLSLIFPPQKACDAQLNQNLPLSCGEKAVMNPKDRPPQLKKEEGINAIAQHNYPKAVRLLTEAWHEKKDPETLIYLNNARILADNIPADKIYTIPVVVPISNAPDFQSKDIVKGIAWLQDRVNKNPDKQWRIRVLIADDGNHITQAQTIAKELAKRQDILVVIGHYSSHLTTNVKHIYQANKLVLVSGSAASQALSSTDPVNNFFFRSAQNTKSASKPLADYLIEKKYQNIAIFYTKGKAFSESFKKELKTHLDRRVKIVGDFDLEEDTSKVKSNVARVKKEFKDAAIVLSPDAYTTSNEGDNQLAVIKENNGELLIAGNETVRDDKVLALGKQALRKMVVATPFYPSSSNKKEFQDFWGKTEKPTWLVILSYDALQMAIHGIENQPGEPTRIGVQKVLADKGFKAEGLSGRITLNGSDRRENTNTLIEPDCSGEYCYWRPKI